VSACAPARDPACAFQGSRLQRRSMSNKCEKTPAMTPNLRAGKTVDRARDHQGSAKKAYANSLVYSDVVMRAGDGIQFRPTGRARGQGLGVKHLPLGPCQLCRQ